MPFLYCEDDKVTAYFLFYFCSCIVDLCPHIKKIISSSDALKSRHPLLHVRWEIIDLVEESMSVA